MKKSAIGRIKPYISLADNENDLTPLPLEEAMRIVGISSHYSSNESLSLAVLDFTAIARAYLRKLPHKMVLNPTFSRYNI
jgi:hypothetical protein